METATHSASTCCEDTCQTGTVCRPRYFPRQIITPDELTLEQDYFRSRLRMHNLMLHGWGVVCGARVCPKRKEDGTGYMPWTVVVERGYAIGRCGDEIILDCPRTVDLRTPGVSGVTGDPCVEPVDPWCSDVYEERDENEPLYIAVRYKETRTRPVRVQPVGCGCDDSRCEYSRWCDSYEIAVLRECPTPRSEPRNGNGDRQTMPGCPETATSPWLGLAEVSVNADGTITRIDNCSCRRLVRGLADAWWQCEASKMRIDTIEPPELLAPRGGKNIEIKLSGGGFHSEMRVDLGRGVTVRPPTVDEEAGLAATINFDVESNAELGPHTLTLTGADCAVARMEGAVRVTEPTKVADAVKRERRSPARPRPVKPPES